MNFSMLSPPAQT